MDEPTLFSGAADRPLAERQRPHALDEMVGQRHFLNAGFKRMLESDRWTGLLFWGPPGCGKTTLARIVAAVTGRTYHAQSAVTSGVKEIRAVLEASRAAIRMGQPAHILFIDEVHRLNKGQQDVLLPFLEDGSIRFIGATTENPSFEINNAICSRSVIFNFKALSEEDIRDVVRRAECDHKLEEEVIERLAMVAGGDARRALTLLEHLTLSKHDLSPITIEDFEKLKDSQNLYYDKKSESHYDTISAFIKSVRGSDPDAALYYLARMIEGGEDPLFIARRLIILASEDIGNANPMALVLATNAFQGVHAIGMPEGRIILGQTTTYLACSEKSNKSYRGIDMALAKVKETGPLDIPYAIRNAPTKMMKDWGYGKDYKYAHNHDNAWAKMQFLPDKIKDERFYRPSERGVEKRFQDFLKERGKD